MPYSQVCHIGLTVFLSFLLAQKCLEVHGRKLRRESFKELSTEAEEDVAAPVYYQGVDGEPGMDFPTLSYIPRTTFSCAEMESGYYADTETGCQVFHICNNGAKVSFLCPNGTIFQQSELICEWWFKVNCSVAPSLYQDSAEQFQLDNLRRKESRRVTGTTRGTSRPTGFTQAQTSSTPQPKESFSHQRTSSSRRNNFNTSPRTSLYDQFQERSTSRGPTVYKSDSQQQSSNVRKNGKNINRVFSEEPNTERKTSLQRKQFQSTSRIPVSVSYEETQVPEESGSFVRSRFNSISSSLKSTTENPYPNHRKSYSEIQDPKVYSKSYSKLPEKSFYGTSLGPETLSTVPVLPLDATVTQASLTPSNQDELPKTTSFKSSEEDKRTNTLNGQDVTTASEYDVPNDFNVDGVAVVTSENLPQPIKEEDIQINTSGITTTESKLIFLKTTTPSPRSFETPAQRGGKSDKSPRGTEAPSLDFNVNSISVIPSHTHPRSTTENNFYYSSTTLGPPTTSEPKISTSSSDNVSTTREDLVPSTLSPPDSTGSTLSRLNPGPRIGFDYFGTTESSQQQSTLNPNNFVRELNGVIYTTASPRGFSLSEAENKVDSDLSTIENRINFPTNKEGDNILDFTVSTVPTPYTTTLNPPAEVTNDNMKEIINSLIRVAEERLNNDEDGRFATNRPGLVVPPSVSPSTLHSLALYFANAADVNHLHPEDDFMNLNLTESEERSVIDMLLTEATRAGYESLFKSQTRTPDAEGTTTESVTTTTTVSDDEDPNFPPQNTSVRELARLFTSALSSYLHDPDSFRKTLQGVRPTEPPVEGRTETNPEDEEVLNFSDSDHSVKSRNGNSQSTTAESSTGSTTSGPRISTTTVEPQRDSTTYAATTEKLKPTLGFVIAYDANSDSDNTIDQNGENLQTADSQSFVSQNANSLVPEKEYEQKSTLFDKGITSTTISYTEKPEPVVTYRPRPTVGFIVAYDEPKSKTFIPTETISESYTTERTQATSFDQTDSRSTLFWTTKDGLPNNHWTTSSDITKLLQSALALDPLTVNYLTTSGISGTTESVTAGEVTEATTKSLLENAESLYAEATKDNNRLNNVLMTIMKNTTNERERVRLILDKLNLTEDEFRNRMKEIESNPLAKRLVLLLVNKCNRDKNHEGGTTNEVDTTTTEQITETTTGGNPQYQDSNVFKKFVDENLTDENEDTRALQLLNSLYVIASKFNK